MALIATMLFIVAIVLVLFVALSVYQAKRNAAHSDTDRTLTTSELEHIIQARIDEAQQPLLDQIQTLEAQLRNAPEQDEEDTAPQSKQRRVR